MGFFDLHEPEDGQDRFFLYAMIILPIISTGAYIFDAWYHFVHAVDERTYEGLLSTIVIVFSHLQYCAPIRSRKALALYHLLLCAMSQAATFGYLLFYIRKGDTFQIFFYSSMIFVDVCYTIGLLYCRVYHHYESHIAVENKHLFHFISRLEVILTIFIPTYMKLDYSSLTRNIIAYFLLFDFFSDSYAKFQGIWIKAALYLFATTTTVSVAAEWFYFNHQIHLYEEISLVAELVATILCDLIIILQFFPFHFKTQFVQNIARQAMLFHQTLNAVNTRASIAVSEAMSKAKEEATKENEEFSTDITSMW